MVILPLEKKPSDVGCVAANCRPLGAGRATLNGSEPSGRSGPHFGNREAMELVVAVVVVAVGALHRTNRMSDGRKNGRPHRIGANRIF